MNHYLKKICAMVLAALMAISGSQFVSVAGNGKNEINIEETEAANSRLEETEWDVGRVHYSDELYVNSELNQYHEIGEMGELKLDKQISGKIKSESVLNYFFTPVSTGYYQIEAHADIDSKKDIHFDMYIGGYNVETHSVSRNENKKDIVYQALLPRNGKNSLQIQVYGMDMPKTVSYTIKITKVKEHQINENNTVASSFHTAFVPYCFEAKDTRVYELSAFSEFGEVRLSSIYDQYNNVIKYNNGERLYFKCNKGQKYFFYVIYNGDYRDEIPGEVVKYTLNVEKVKSHSSFEYVIENNQATIVGYTGTDSAVTIPTSVEGIPVVGIGDNAFACSDNILKVEIPANIKTIGACAFYNCSNLKSVTISEGVNAIESGAFWNCSSLQSAKVPKSVKKIGDRIFFECENLNTAVIDAEVQSFYGLIFYNCGKLKTVKLPKTLTAIGYEDFYGCKNLSEIVIPDLVTSIDERAFGDCTKLSNIKLPQNLRTIGSGAFLNCANLKSLTIPSSLERIDYEAFSQCSNLKEIVFPKKLSKIESNAFEYCTKLKKVTLPSALTDLGDHAFAYCTALESVVLPEKLEIDIRKNYNDTGIPDTSTRYNPFAYCSRLKNISVHQSNKTLKVNNGVLYAKNPYKKDSYILVVCPSGKSGSVSVYEKNEYILSNAFEGCSQVTELSISAKTDLAESYDSITGLINLKKISIDSKNKTAKSVKGVVYSKDGKRLYWYPNTASGKVTVSEGVTDLTRGFWNCSKITEIMIPASVNDIYSGLFAGCDSLQSIKVDSKHKAYKSVNGSVCSKDGKELYTVPAGIKGQYVIPEGVETLEYVSFGANITKIKIPASVIKIGYNGHWSSSGNNVEAYDVDSKNKYFSSKSGVLYDKKQETLIMCPPNIKNFTIPSTVTTIGDYAFTGGRPGITRLALPKNVKSMGFKTFWGCKFDIYFECAEIPFDNNAFNYKTKVIGYYDASKLNWDMAISNQPYLYGISWKKMDSKATSFIKLDKSSTSLTVGETCTLKATVTNASGKLVTWSSSDKNVATVSNKGVVTAKSIGKAIITAKCDGKTAKCTVTVDLAQPKLKKAASAEKGKIKVSWSKVSGATGYIVYKKSGKEWKKLATVKSPSVSYTDKGLISGKKYIYTVKC